MATTNVHSAAARGRGPTNGGALAALLAAGVGAFAVGLFVILAEADVFAPPALYGPAGGVSGRTTFAVVVWLLAWGLLHRRFRSRQLDSGRVVATTLILIGLGLLATFPPVWRIF